MHAAIALVLALAATPPTQDRRISVFTLRAPPELSELAARTTDELLLAVGQSPGVVAIGEAELAVLLEHDADRHALKSCAGGEACLAKLTRAVAAEKVITGRLGRWGGGYLAALVITDSSGGSIERGESVFAEDETTLLKEIRPLVARLLGVSAQTTATGTITDSVRGAKLAVLDLERHDAGEDLAANLTLLLALELKNTHGLDVISREEVRALLAYETEKQIVLKQSDTSALVEIGAALGVRFLVAGAVGRLDDTFVVHLKLMDVERAAVLSRVSESLRGPPTQLASAIRFGVYRLLGGRITGNGNVEVLTSEASAASIDGGKPVPLPAVLELDAGKHSLFIVAEGYRDHFQEFYVEPNLTTRVSPNLEPLPRAWWEEWWAWAAIGGAVAVGAGVAAAIVASRADNGEVILGPLP